MKIDLGVYLIADFSKGIDKIEEAVKFGVDIIQLREKDISSREYFQRAVKIRELTKKYGTVFIVNDRVDIALLSEADGVHLGQADIPVQAARKLLKGKIIGSTARTVEQAVKAEAEGADYIGTGAWFETKTKKDAVLLPLDVYKEILSSTTIPNVAVGGITPLNCETPFMAGAYGVAVSSGILDSENVTGAIDIIRKVKNRYDKKITFF